MKLRYLLGLTSTIVFLATSLAHGGTHDWGTEGVSDTSKVDSVFQVTGDEIDVNDENNDSLSGQTYPQGAILHLDSWDSNGEWIVYTSQRGANSNSNYEVCKIKADGSEFTQLTTNAQEDSNASFASDGNIYFGRDNGTKEIYRMKADGTGTETNLSEAHSATANEYGPKVSPDASHYAYLSDSKLYVSQADGNGTQQQVSDASITIQEWSPYSFSWSPDSQWLTYVGYDTTGYWIYKVKADGSEHEVLSKPAIPAGSHRHSWPTWSPDGTQISYIENVYTSPTQYYDLMVIDPEGNVLSDPPLDSTSYNSSDPNFYDWSDIKGPITWSPDSKWLGYTKEFRDQSGTDDYISIVIVNTADNSKKYTLTSGYYEYSPLWSPDGSKILFADSYGYYASRDDSDDFGTGTDFAGDLLLLNLSDDYALPLPQVPFAWPMFMPAIIGDTTQ
jgi:Tol biopolymer transport system component